MKSAKDLAPLIAEAVQNLSLTPLSQQVTEWLTHQKVPEHQKEWMTSSREMLKVQQELHNKIFPILKTTLAKRHDIDDTLQKTLHEATNPSAAFKVLSEISTHLVMNQKNQQDNFTRNFKEFTSMLNKLNTAMDMVSKAKPKPDYAKPKKDRTCKAFFVAL